MSLARGAVSPAAPASANWPAANQAIYMPLRITAPYDVRRVFAVSGSAAANWDIGVYTLAGAKLFSSGSTAGTNNTLVYANVTATTLSPGMYWLACWCAGTTNTLFLSTAVTVLEGRAMGFRQETGLASGLPATASFAQLAACNGMPVCGITRTSANF